MAEASLYRRVLVIGGARSGKSGYAVALAESAHLLPVMLATAQAADPEMAERIARHRAERSSRWITHEEPLDLIGALRRCVAPDRIVVVDCATLWLSNLLGASRDLEAEGRALADELAALSGPVVFVSNEVGYGLVPSSAVGRRFRDAQGRLNQMLAQACDAVVEVKAGLPLQIKPASLPRIAF